MQFGGVFWQTFRGFQNSANSINQLLDREDVSLFEVLDDDNVIQELKNQNSKLIDFFTAPRLEELVSLLTSMPDVSVDHKRGHKYPFVASELITCEVPQLIDMFFSSPNLFLEVFRYLKSESKAPILDGYFSKLVSVLLNRNSESVIRHMSENGSLDDLIDSLKSKSISDLILKILTNDQINLEIRKEIVLKLVDQVCGADEVKVLYSGQVLTEVLNKVTEQPGLKDLALFVGSREVLEKVCDALRREVFNTAAAADVFKLLITGGIRDDLLRPAKVEEELTNMEEEETEFVKRVLTVISIVSQKLKRESLDFLGTNKRQVKVLGNDRVKIIELLLATIRADNKEFFLSLQKNEVFETLTELFFSFETNSILHNYYEQFFSLIFERFRTEEELLVDLLRKSRFLENLENNTEGKGYSGHLIKLVSTLNKVKERNPEFSKHLDESEGFRKFLAEVYLKKIELEKKNLGEAKVKTPEDLSSDDSGHDKNTPKDLIEMMFEKREEEGEEDKPLEMEDLKPNYSESPVKTTGKGRYEDGDSEEKVSEEGISDEEYWKF